MRTVTKTIDGKMKTLTEKHFLSPEEHKHYLALLKEIEGTYNIDRKRLFFSKQASEELDEAKQFLAEAIKKLAMNHEEYEFYTTSYIIRITESGMKEQVSNVAESKKVLTEAIGASVLNKCYADLHKAIPEPLLNSLFEKYFYVHLDSIILFIWKYGERNEA